MFFACQCVIPSRGSVVMVRTFKHIGVSTSKELSWAFDVRHRTLRETGSCTWFVFVKLALPLRQALPFLSYTAGQLDWFVIKLSN